MMMPLDFGRALMHAVAERLVPDPLKQERRPHGLAEFLKREAKAIARAVAVEACQHGGWRQLAGLDADGKLHELGVLLSNEVPVDGATKQRVDRLKVLPLVGFVEPEFLPVSNARHELDTQEIGESEDGGRLAVGVCVDTPRLQIRSIELQGVEDVDRLVMAASDEIAEQRDVVVGDVPVGDAAGLAVADMAFGEQIVLVGREMRAVRDGRLARSPQSRQFELSVQIDEIGRGAA